MSGQVEPIEPLRLAFDVDCPPERAFMVWTERIAAWWPADHTASGEPNLQVVLEGHIGGRIYERTSGGAEHDWGEVTAWDPPHRFAYLWHLRRDRTDATEVEIRFVPDGAATRVEIEHRGWERLGAEGRAWRDRNMGGWSTLLPHYIEAARASRAAPNGD
jgi:uncharacterized protein YndB with AHSA1/START domain